MICVIRARVTWPSRASAIALAQDGHAELLGQRSRQPFKLAFEWVCTYTSFLSAMRMKKDHARGVAKGRRSG